MSQKRAGVYARLSLTTEESVSIGRQLEACRQYAEQRGYTVAVEAIDDSVSATRYAPEKRPGFRRLLDAAPELDLVIGWKVDRLARRTLDFLRVHETLQGHGCSLAAVQDHIDLSTPQGRAFATILSVFAEMEAASISARTRDARAYLLANGRAAGNPPWFLRSVPNPDGAGRVWELIPDRADAIREAVRGLMLGRDTLRGIGRRWDSVPELRPRPRRRRGVDTSPDWTPSGVRRLLQSPVLYGATLNRGDVLRDADGLVLVDASREVLTFAEWTSLQAALERRAAVPVRRGDASLCGGVLLCHSCREPLHPNRHGRVPRYLCNTDGCARPVAVAMRPVEAALTDRYLGDFGADDVLIADTAPDAAEVARLQEAIAALTEQMGRASDEAALLPVFRQRAELQERLSASAATRGPAVMRSAGVTRGERWADADTAERNGMLRAAYAVIVRPGERGRRFDASRLDIVGADRW